MELKHVIEETSNKSTIWIPQANIVSFVTIKQEYDSEENAFVSHKSSYEYDECINIKKEERENINIMKEDGVKSNSENIINKNVKNEHIFIKKEEMVCMNVIEDDMHEHVDIKEEKENKNFMDEHYEEFIFEKPRIDFKKELDIQMAVKAEKQDAEIGTNEIDNDSLMGNGKNDHYNFAFVSIKTENDEVSHNTVDVCIDIKKEVIENVNLIVDDCAVKHENDLFEDPLVDCKSEIDIEEHSLAEVKKEPMLNTQIPQDGSTSQADMIVDREINKTNGKSERPYACEICTNAFKNQATLDSHMRRHTGERPYECETCKKSFTQPGALKIHMRKHTGERPYECKICKSTFIQTGALTAHMRQHSGERPFECKICKKTFINPGSLSIHMRNHTGEGLHKCEICEKTFAQIGSLTTHMRYHTDERPYECAICKKTFRQSSTLARHVRSHSGEKPYECEICKKTFTQTGSLTAHMRKHTGERLYECKICMKNYSNKSYLLKHTKKHTGEKAV